MPSEARLRLFGLLKGCLIALAIGLAYALLARFTPFSIPCPIRRLTGLLCPGCGVTRMCVALLGGHLKAAWEANPMLMCLSPLLALCGLWHGVAYVRNGGAARSRVLIGIEVCLVVSLVAFGVWRNLPL